MSMQDPFTLGKAQKAQQSLAATMDSYLDEPEVRTGQCRKNRNQDLRLYQ